MFFGKSTPPEEVRLDDLQKLLDSSFEKKLGNLEIKAGQVTKELEPAVRDFANACDSLEKQDAQPYTGNIYLPDITSLKDQKVAYAKAVKRIIGGMALVPDMGLNTYGRYKALLSHVDEVTNDVLKANANFKLVMYCFANNLRDLRKTFSAIEKLREGLRREIEGRSREALEYEAVGESIAKLGNEIEEIGVLNTSIKDLKDRVENAGKNIVKHDVDGLSSSLEVKKSEVSKAKAESSEISRAINLLSIPLERTAKKFDHGSVRKKQLHTFIMDPIGTIKSEVDYNEFKAMLKELSGSIDAGTVEVKSKPETIGIISTLVNSDIYSKINALRTANEKAASLERELKVIERTLADIRNGRMEHEQMLKEIEAMERKLEDTTNARASTKKVVEALFVKYYKRTVSIIL